ncbi:unnamed protein product [Cylindrotheca closterium]|uniref:Uncharacterized protein n=1 Tax=Cylindrotheca closterium TaxID=2856 RepID=A0AAD2JL87_9STRA|nr:unnamed protein product [Cylindrotheca closterium]
MVSRTGKAKRGVPKDVQAWDNHSCVSVITFEDDSEANNSTEFKATIPKRTRAQEILNILDGIDAALKASSKHERKQLGKEYSTMPILKPERKKSLEGLPTMRNAAFDRPIKKETSPFDAVIRRNEERIHLGYGIGSALPKMPMPTDKMRRAQSVPTDVNDEKWEDKSSRSPKNSVFKTLRKPVRKGSIDMSSPDKEAYKNLKQGNKQGASMTSPYNSCLSLSKPAFQSTLIEAATTDILSKPVRRLSMDKKYATMQ